MNRALHDRPKQPELRWVDGALCRAQADDVRLASLAEPGSYTSARVENGRALFAFRHCQRLQRDGRLLGLGEPQRESVLELFCELGRAAFGHDAGIVRVDLREGGGSRGRLFGRARTLGPEPAHWHAAIAPLSHPGPGSAPGAKRSAVPALERARRYARERGLDECLLLDADGCLVEGTRSNLLIVSAEGALLTPEAKRGAVAGIGLGVLCERGPTPCEAAIDVGVLRAAREIVAVNAVRGARPICRLDTRDVGGGRPGPWAEQIAAALAEAGGRPA